MHDLTPLTPLFAEAAQVDTIAGVTQREVTDVALASVAARLGGEAETQALVAGFIGGAAPGPGYATLGDLSAFWIGPEQWMIEAPLDNYEDLAAQLAAKTSGKASVTEQTDGWCRFDLEGDGLAAVFELLCPLDLRNYAGGEATRTTIDHLGCFVICRTPQLISVLGPRSAAGSLHHALVAAMRAAG